MPLRVILEKRGSPVDQVQSAALPVIGTVYDMCKAVVRGMVMGDICLVEKLGGKSGHCMADHAAA